MTATTQRNRACVGRGIRKGDPAEDNFKTFAAATSYDTEATVVVCGTLIPSIVLPTLVPSVENTRTTGSLTPPSRRTHKVWKTYGTAPTHQQAPSAICFVPRRAGPLAYSQAASLNTRRKFYTIQIKNIKKRQMERRKYPGLFIYV